MTELRAQINMRTSADSNISLVFTDLVSDESEAQDAGYRAAALFTAWNRGWTKQTTEEMSE